MSITRRAEITLHQLRIFWSIAHSDTLTSAAKQLGMAQPSMSQQLSRLEAIVGTRLFERRSNEMVLTAAGTYLLPRAEHVLRSVDALEEGLGQYRNGSRMTVRIAGITSMLRALLPEAITQTQRSHSGIDFDIQDCAPSDILDLLHSRRVRVGLLAANSVAADALDFHQVPLMDDPLLLAVPEALSLDGITDPKSELASEAYALLNRTIQFTFGTSHGKRVEALYERILPDHHVFTLCRSFEIALGLVEAGAGICLAPALAVQPDLARRRGIRFYRIDELPRRLVALVASQDHHQAPYDALLDGLQQAARSIEGPEIRPLPPFLLSDPDER